MHSAASSRDIVVVISVTSNTDASGHDWLNSRTLAGSTRKFAAGPNSLAGKFFAETAEDAAKWGELLEGAGNYRIITADVPTSAAEEFMRWVKLDAIGPARYAELEQLGNAVIGVFK